MFGAEQTVHGAQPVSVVALQSDTSYSDHEQTVHDAHVPDVTVPSDLQVCNENGGKQGCGNGGGGGGEGEGGGGGGGEGGGGELVLPQPAPFFPVEHAPRHQQLSWQFWPLQYWQLVGL